MPAHRTPKGYLEELIIYGTLVVIGAIPAVIAVVQRTVFGVEATIGLIMMFLGAVGAIAYALRNHNHRTT